MFYLYSLSLHAILFSYCLIENTAALLIMAVQEMKERLGSATGEISSLMTALENQTITYNEEVDNLYTLINAIILGLVAIGGVGGWTTIRRKRKG